MPPALINANTCHRYQWNGRAGLDEGCSYEDMFENVANDDFGELQFQVRLVYSDGTVGSAAFDAQSREVYINPLAVGPAHGLLTVVDSREAPLTTFMWNFTVYAAPQSFALRQPRSAGCTEEINRFRAAAVSGYTVGESKIVSGDLNFPHRSHMC